MQKAEVEQEYALVDFIEPTLNPFDDNADSMGSLVRNSYLNQKKKNKYARKREQINSIKEDDLRKELSSDNTLISYFED